MKYPCLLTKKINEISSAKYNPRKITDEAMGRLTKSLAEFGNIQPITWNVRTGNVVGGHQRLKVYKAMGKTEVDVWAVDLDEQKEKAANIARACRKERDLFQLLVEVGLVLHFCDP